MKKITSFIMALLLVIQCTAPVQAENTAVKEEQTEMEEKAIEDTDVDNAVDKESLSSRFKILLKTAIVLLSQV